MVKKSKQSAAKNTGELMYGINPVVEMLKAKKRKIVSIYTTKPTPKGFKDIEKELPKYPVPIQYVEREVLHRMAGTTDHQGVIAWVQKFPFRVKPFTSDKHPFLVMLDGIQDPRNLGAILRSAYCAGVDGVIITQKNSAPVNAVVLKTSAGLAEHLNVLLVPSAESAARELKKAGYNMYLATFGGKNAATYSYKTPVCLVVGSEGAGISKGMYAHGTQVTLPQRTNDISYNASVAAGLLMFLVATQQGKI